MRKKAHRQATDQAAAAAGVRHATLVEVMIAILILALVTITGGAYLTHSRASIMVQRNRRSATEVANRRLEELRGVAFEDITPATPSGFSPYFLENIGVNEWQISQTDPEETVIINGIEYPMVTTVALHDVDGGISNYDYLTITVRVQYRRGSQEEVVLESMRAP